MLSHTSLKQSMETQADHLNQHMWTHPCTAPVQLLLPAHGVGFRLLAAPARLPKDMGRHIATDLFKSSISLERKIWYTYGKPDLIEAVNADWKDTWTCQADHLNQDILIIMTMIMMMKILRAPCIQPGITPESGRTKEAWWREVVEERENIKNLTFWSPDYYYAWRDKTEIVSNNISINTG